MEEILIIAKLIGLAVVTFVSAFIAGHSKACMDIVQHKFKRSVFSLKEDYGYYDPAISWKNKDKKKSKLYKTIFVWTTDFWHKMGMLYAVSLSLNSFICGTFFHENPWTSIAVFVACQIYYRIVFEYYYSTKLMKDG